MSVTNVAAPMTDTELDQLSVKTIRTLSIDAVERAKSGHPDTPMALAPLVFTIWNRVMRFDPEDPIWPNRDRFVLSNGHASMLLWSVLRLRPASIRFGSKCLKRRRAVSVRNGPDSAIMHRR
jgi:transketolase